MRYSRAEELLPGVKSYYDVWPESQELIKQLEINSEKGLAWVPAAINKEGKGPVVDTQVRVLEVLSITRFESAPTNGHPLVESAYGTYVKISSNLDAIVEEYAKEYSVAVTSKEPYQILRYKENNFFRYHVDDSPNRPRRLSYCYYVNDDYEGGELHFGKFDKTIKPEAGQLVVFPSNYMYAHAARPILTGTKYVVSSWWN